jgi:hypothetical protein
MLTKTDVEICKALNMSPQWAVLSRQLVESGFFEGDERPANVEGRAEYAQPSKQPEHNP